MLAPDLPFHFRKLLKNVATEKEAHTTQDASRSTNGRGWRKIVTTPIKNLLCPDPQRFWAPRALARAAQIVRERNIDTVIVTAPPFSVFLTSNELKRRFPHLTLVTDYRDEWLTYYFNTLSVNQNSYARRRAAEIERASVQLSDHVVGVTSRALDEMRLRYPAQRASKFQLIPNGFDPDIFACFEPRPRLDSKVVISYTGTIYKPSQPGPLVEALASLAPEVRERLDIRIIGHIEAASDRRLLESQRPTVTIEGFLPKNEALSRVQETDYLLLIWHDEINIPGKLYEYLATGKPILALAPANSEVRNILQHTRGGWWADIHKPGDISRLIEAACGVGHARLASHFHPDSAQIRGFEWPSLAAQYAELLHGSTHVKESREDAVPVPCLSDFL